MRERGRDRWAGRVAGMLCALALASSAGAEVTDEARLERAGIRRLVGKRLTLYTDVPASAEVDGLVEAFDQAYPQWCRYFEVAEDAEPAWQMTGYLMRDRRRFDSLGLIPAEVPDFLHGYALGYTLWMYDQPTDYYRRHLLLHEGTHGFMYTRLGGTGATWYMEGIAERLVTHDEQDGRIVLGHFPVAREEVPMLARIKLVQDAVTAGRRLSLDDVRALSYREFVQNEAYAWVWSAAAFLDEHPVYRQRFRELQRHVRATDFDAAFERLFAADRQACEVEWALFVDTLEHGHDVPRTALDFSPGTPWQTGSQEIVVQADRGWQNTGLWLEAGRAYKLRASGRYQVANEPRPWWCEPGGVTIRYYRGAPLGILQAAVWGEEDSAAMPDDQSAGGEADELSGFLQPTNVGLRARVVAPAGGTLYLRVNDSAGELDDNAGTLQVRIEAP